MELERHGADGLYVGRNIVALGTIATGYGADEHTVFILQADAQAVKLQFAAKLQFAVDAFLDAVDESEEDKDKEPEFTGVLTTEDSKEKAAEAETTTAEATTAESTTEEETTKAE